MTRHLISHRGSYVLCRDRDGDQQSPSLNLAPDEHSVTDSQTHKVLKNQKTQTLPLFLFLPPHCWSLYTPSSPPWVSNQWVDTGNASHGWPYKDVRKPLISGFRAQMATPFPFTSIASVSLPLLPPASCLYQLIFHTGGKARAASSTKAFSQHESLR